MDQKKKNNTKIVVIVCAVVAVLAVAIAGGVWFMTNNSKSIRSVIDRVDVDVHTVHISVKASDGSWNTANGASRVPVQIRGTDLDKKKVDEVQYVNTDGDGIKLKQGKYKLTVAASPFAADGTIYSVPNTALEVSFKNPKEGEAIEATDQGGFDLSPIAALDVTDDEISQAYEYAGKDTGDGAADAGSLKSAATKRHTDAVEQKKEAELTIKTAHFTVKLPSGWYDRVNVEKRDDSITVTSKKDPDLEVCALWYYDDDETDWASPADCGWGDVAHSDEGAVYLSEFEWGRQIAEYKREASSDPDKYYSMGEANEITLLQYLGTRTYDRVLDATDDSHNHSDNPAFDVMVDYFENNVTMN